MSVHNAAQTARARRKTVTWSAVVFLGPPGAGKGTQSHAVASRMQVPYLSTGDMLRQHVARASELGNKARTIMEAGELVSDALVNAMVAGWFEKERPAGGCVLDGYPRTLSQAKALSKVLGGKVTPVVINLRVEYNKLIQRLTGRRTCPQCGRTYNVFLKPPVHDGVCDLDGVALIQRSDDQENVIRERLAAYESQTAPMVQFYRRRRKYFEVDGNQQPESVTAELCRIVESVVREASR